MRLGLPNAHMWGQENGEPSDAPNQGIAAVQSPFKGELGVGSAW